MSHLHPHARWPLAVLTASLLAACGGGGGGGDTSVPVASSPSSAPPRPISQTDLEIATSVFAGKRVPEGFYTEPAANDAVNATLHLKNTDIDPSITAAQPQYELCTNDWNQALGWSETNASNAQVYADLVATNDDARFFEFARVRAGSPAVYTQTRVFKCTYVDRTNANLRTNDGAAGQLNVRPLNADELERFSEYVFRFTRYNNFGHSVLQSAGNTSALEHTLHIASLVRDGLSTDCDRIDVIAWRHRVDPTTGAITLDTQTLWSFGARESAGVAQLCSVS